MLRMKPIHRPNQVIEYKHIVHDVSELDLPSLLPQQYRDLQGEMLKKILEFYRCGLEDRVWFDSYLVEEFKTLNMLNSHRNKESGLFQMSYFVFEQIVKWAGDQAHRLQDQFGEVMQSDQFEIDKIEIRGSVACMTLISVRELDE